MTTTLPIPGGLANKEIVDLAYTALGLSDSMFGRTDEEYAKGMTLLRAMMGEYPFDQLGFDAGDNTISGESNVERKWLTALGYSLAQRVGDSIGKTLKPGAEATRARSYSRLCSSVATITERSFAPGTATGSGHKGWATGTYFAEPG